MITPKISRNSWIILIILILTLSCPITWGKTIYVDDDATGAGDGSSWENAYTYLQDALADANDSEKPVEIHIAQGVYKPDQGDNLVSGDQEVTFQLVDGVSLLGGFAGIPHAESNLRNIEIYRTILSGDLNGDDEQALGDVYAERYYHRSDNSYHIVTGLHVNQTAVLDGVILTGSRSAAMYNTFSNAILTHCTFSSNLAESEGGGIYNSDSSPTLRELISTQP